MPDARTLTTQIVTEFGRDGRSTRQIAAHAGVSAQTVYRWQSGECAPRLPEFCFMAEALGLEVVLVPKGPAP